MGGECLRLLLADPWFTRVAVPTRRPLGGFRDSPALDARVVDFERLESHRDLLAADAVVCSLGTTIRKAGSRTAFRRVDHDYPLLLARLALEEGARHFVLVSALGADPRSRVFYNRVKGEVEDAVRALGYRGVSILRPSLLLGERRESRLGEEVAKRFARLVPGRYRPVEARDVAAAALHLLAEDAPGVRVVESAEIRAWAGAA